MSAGLTALVTARRLLRTFRSAPDPRRQARLIYSSLNQLGAWPPTDQARIDAFGRWLDTMPAESELQPTCAVLVNRLAPP